jgi:hypothetical protein
MAFREVLVTEVKEVLRAWLAGQGKRPAARRAQVNVKTAQRYIAAAQAAGLSRDGGERQLTDELIGKLIRDLATLRFIDDIGNPRYQNLLNARRETCAA